jgi:Uma2 family endonuclease
MATATLPLPTPAVGLMTAEEFFAHHAHPRKELWRGRLVEYPDMPSLRHGQVCSRAGRLIGNFVEDNNLGQTMSNDSHIVVKRNPDTVLGPDLCYFSYERMPKGPAPDTLSELIPELTVEVRSPSNTWTKIFGKVGDYLAAGVTAVLVLDPDGMTASVYRASGQVIHHTGDQLDLADVLPGFVVPVRRFFE